MHHRNERNAIIQHGTMTMVRRGALEATGAWSEWTICEDAELGLRLMRSAFGRATLTRRAMRVGLSRERERRKYEHLILGPVRGPRCRTRCVT